MKILITFLAVSVIALTKCAGSPIIRQIPYDIREELISNLQICREYLDGEAFANLKIHKLVENDAMKNFLFCMHKKGGTQNSDGSFNVENLKQRMAMLTGSNDYDYVVDECTQKDRLSGEENAWAWAMCAKKKMANIRFY